MGKIRLSYCTFGLSTLHFRDALDAVERAGYAGVEISFQRGQFNPFNIDDDYLASVRQHLDRLRLQPACVATASYFFTPSRPHEPSLIAVEPAARKRRIDLIRRGIRVARRLGAPLVSFGSGFVRAEHLAHPDLGIDALLVDSIRECLREIHADEDITLLIEPEPGMYIETVADGLELIGAVNSPNFKLHLDLCHAYCSEADYHAALARAAPETRYLHLSDACAGYNLTILEDTPALDFDLDFASLLVHFADTADYLLLDRRHPVYFHDGPVSAARRERIDVLLARTGVAAQLQLIDYASLYAGDSPLDDEVFTWMISVPGLSYDVLERAKPVAAWLRGARGTPLVERRLANTLTGIAHYHEIPGEGTLDFAASFGTLTAHGYSGFGSVELYHHLAAWETALRDSYRHLAPLVAAS